MKRYILIAITAISIMSFAEVKINKRALLEKYRKEALLQEEKKEKEAKATSSGKSNTGVSSSCYQNRTETSKEVEDERFLTQVDEDIIEFVNYYLRRNPEKKGKLEQHYKNVVGQE